MIYNEIQPHTSGTLPLLLLRPSPLPNAAAAATPTPSRLIITSPSPSSATVESPVKKKNWKVGPGLIESSIPKLSSNSNKRTPIKNIKKKLDEKNEAKAWANTVTEALSEAIEKKQWHVPLQVLRCYTRHKKKHRASLFMKAVYAPSVQEYEFHINSIL